MKTQISIRFNSRSGSSITAGSYVNIMKNFALMIPFALIIMR
jgi:undecaprenyl pyrophosphate phosphatase UppP